MYGKGVEDYGTGRSVCVKGVSETTMGEDVCREGIGDYGSRRGVEGVGDYGVGSESGGGVGVSEILPASST